MQAANATNEELERARSELRDVCDVAVISWPAHVTYVSGFDVPPVFGVVEATAYAPPFAVISVNDTTSWLAASILEAPAAREWSRLSHLVTFDAFDSFKPADPKATYLNALIAALNEAGLRQAGTVGMEGRALPTAAAEAITSAFPVAKLVDIHEALVRARLIKTGREIDLLRRIAEIAAVGQRTLAKLVQTPGQNEFDLWNSVIDEMSKAAGRQLPVAGEIVSGDRTATVAPGGPADRVTREGDPVLMDISQRLNGYWSDCTNSHVVGGGEPSERVKQLARAAQSAFEAAFETLRPGSTASDVWQAAESAYQKHGMEPPHYMGHQLGTTVNELPRLAQYDQTPIQAGMVFAVEPGAYELTGGTAGVRFEKIMLVTSSGAEILTHFDWGIAV
jgi:Xaa-Pro aminopeptidase